MTIYCGDVGEDPHEIEFEPFTTPAIPEPAPSPVPVEPERIPVPA